MLSTNVCYWAPYCRLGLQDKPATPLDQIGQMILSAISHGHNTEVIKLLQQIKAERAVHRLDVTDATCKAFALNDFDSVATLSANLKCCCYLGTILCQLFEEQHGLQPFLQQADIAFSRPFIQATFKVGILFSPAHT